MSRLFIAPMLPSIFIYARMEINSTTKFVNSARISCIILHIML